MAKRYWSINGYKGTELIFRKEIPIGQITENQIKEALKCLTAKAGLNFDEIIYAYTKRNTKIYAPLLEIVKDGPYPRFYCGTNPHFIAYVVEINADGKIHEVEYR